MGTPETPEFDQELWFTADYCAARHILLASYPFTFPGRIAAWCPADRVAYRISKSDIVTCSDATRYWVRGFLMGNTPEPPRDADDDWLPDEDPAMQRWREAAALFQMTGIWKHGDPGPCSECGEELLPSKPGFVCGACLAKGATTDGE